MIDVKDMRLFYAKTDVIFALPQYPTDIESRSFLDEEYRNNNIIHINEIESFRDIPKHWMGCGIYGISDHMDPSRFFDIKTNQLFNHNENLEKKEFQEYLRLKEKFKGTIVPVSGTITANIGTSKT